MPRSKKRKSSINNLSNARSSRHSNASDSKEEHVEASSFSFMKNEGGRPKKKKKVSLVRARSILWDNDEDLGARTHKPVDVTLCKKFFDHAIIYFDQ